MFSVYRAAHAAFVLAGFTLLASPGLSTTDEDLIVQATAAAPPGVSANATVMVTTEAGGLRMLREGSNGFTCLPAMADLGFEAMCLDDNGLAWLRARRAGVQPIPSMVGIGYVYASGDSTCPVGAGDLRGAGAVSHVMVVNLPRPAIDHPVAFGPDVGPHPAVAGRDTPYEYLMIPVR